MEGSVEIVETRPDHPDALALIAGSEAEQAAIYPPEDRFAFSPEQLIEAGVVFVVARRGNRALACGGLAPHGDWGELKRVFTVAEARGTGLARAVVDRLENIARARGIGTVRLETGTRSPEAIALYRRCGYVERDAFGPYVGLAAASSVFMEKRF